MARRPAIVSSTVLDVDTALKSARSSSEPRPRRAATLVLLERVLLKTSSGSHKSKTWTKKSDDAKANTKKEMMAFLEVAKEEFRKELNAFKTNEKKKKKSSPKRKQEDESDDESYASAKSVNQFETDEFLFDDDENLAEGTERMTLNDTPDKANKDDESVYTVTSKKDDETTPSTN